MKNKYIAPLMLLASIMLMSMAYSQTLLRSPARGELIFEVKNEPSQYNVAVSFNRQGVLFSGDSEIDCPQPRIYSHTYSNLVGEDCHVDTTQSIIGASRILSNNNNWIEWAVEHIGDGSPNKLDQDDWHWEWIGYGVYRLNVEAIGPGDTYTFYIDYLDSNYPSETDEFGAQIYDDVDIHVDYDFNRTLGQRVVLWTNDATFTNVNGKLFTVWDDLFNPSQPRATEFYLHGTVPLSSLSSDQLFCNVIVDDDITVPSGKSFTVKPDLYPDSNRLPSITLQVASSKKLTVYGTLQAIGTLANSITFDRSGRSGYWGGIFFDGSGSSSSTLKDCIIKNATRAVRTDNSNVTIERNEIDTTDEYGMYLYEGSPTIYNNYIHDTDDYGIAVNDAENTYIRKNSIINCKGGVAAWGDNNIMLRGYSGNNYGLNKIDDWGNGHGVYILAGEPDLGQYSPTSQRGYNDILRESILAVARPGNQRT